MHNGHWQHNPWVDQISQDDNAGGRRTDYSVWKLWRLQLAGRSNADTRKCVTSWGCGGGHAVPCFYGLHRGFDGLIMDCMYTTLRMRGTMTAGYITRASNCSDPTAHRNPVHWVNDVSQKDTLPKDIPQNTTSSDYQFHQANFTKTLFNARLWLFANSQVNLFKLYKTISKMVLLVHVLLGTCTVTAHFYFFIGAILR